MPRRSANIGNQFKPALMANKWFHAGWLTDHGNRRFDAQPIEHRRHLRRTETANLFIKGKGKMHRFGKLACRLLKSRHHRQRNRQKPFHIDRAAPIKPPILFMQNKWITRPARRIGWHNIKMTRQ